MADGQSKDVIGYNVQPDVVIYGVLLNAFIEVGNVWEVVNYVDPMRNSSLPMNAITCNSLIKLYTEVGYFQEALEAYIQE